MFINALPAAAGITIAPVTWNIVGLDSNNVNVGPNTFPVGGRVCNTGAAATNVSASFSWESANSLINLDAGVPGTLNYSSLAANACVDFYFDIVITRTTAAFNTARRFRITATDGAMTATTPTPREIFVEKLVSQNRNTVLSISGPSTVYVGQSYQYTMVADTATNGYEQLEAFLGLSNIIFRITNIATTYTAGGTNNKFYADGCGWDNVPTSPSYRSCIGPVNFPGGKAGGRVTTVYTVKVLSAGTTVASSIIYDYSGSSYHYNSDFGAKNFPITALPQVIPNIALTKSVTPTGASLPGTELTYTISFTSNGSTPAQNFQLVDPNPGGTLRLNTDTDFKVGSVSNALGTTGMTVAVSYSNNNGASYVYTPVSGGGGAPAGFDRSVTHIRWAFTGSFSQIAPNNTGSVSFVVRIR